MTPGEINILAVFEQATAADRAAGMQSWHTSNALMCDLAEQFQFTAKTVTGVFAALSPNNDYFGNLRDTRRVLKSFCAGLSIDSFSVSTYNPNKRKAWAIVGGQDPLELLIAPKTRNFYQNIENPCDPIPVTIDGHMFNIWRGERQPLKGLSSKVSEKRYDEIACAMRSVAYIKNILACELQGILWHTWKRIHRIKMTGQVEIWDAEAIAAGLGYRIPNRPVAAIVK